MTLVTFVSPRMRGGMTAGRPEPGRDLGPLPEFEHPPVAEVALAVSFDPPPGLGVVNLARLLEESFKSEFPTVEEPRWQMPVERLSGPAGAPNVTLQMMATPPIPRVWCQ
jgi:hypothetical protein